MLRCVAIKELVTDANFDCSDEGIVSLSLSTFSSSGSEARFLTRLNVEIASDG